MNEFIPVIDLFAGPGGLGEGFSAFTDASGKHPFKIVLSIEKEKNAHSTLELRAFFREFPDTQKPSEYYSYLRGEIDKNQLFRLYPEQAKRAQHCAWQIELGNGSASDNEIDVRIRERVG